MVRRSAPTQRPASDDASSRRWWLPLHCELRGQRRELTHQVIAALVVAADMAIENQDAASAVAGDDRLAAGGGQREAKRIEHPVVCGDGKRRWRPDDLRRSGAVARPLQADAVGDRHGHASHVRRCAIDVVPLSREQRDIERRRWISPADVSIARAFGPSVVAMSARVLIALSLLIAAVEQLASIVWQTRVSPAWANQSVEHQDLALQIEREERREAARSDRQQSWPTPCRHQRVGP